jgi:hypothetical protein
VIKKRPSHKKIRSTYQRPVLQFRVSDETYRDIKAVAAKKRRTISEEAYWRLVQFELYRSRYGELDYAPLLDPTRYIYDTNVGTEENPKLLFKPSEYRKVRGRDIWVGPNETLQSYVLLDSELTVLLHEAANRAIEWALEKDKQK